MPTKEQRDPKIGLELEFYSDLFPKGEFELVEEVKEGEFSEEELGQLEGFREFYYDFTEQLIIKYAEFFKIDRGLVRQYFSFSEEHKGHLIKYLKMFFFIDNHREDDSGELVIDHGDDIRLRYWIKPTLDSGCLEIVALPITVSQYKDQQIRNVLEHFLFKVMEKDFSTSSLIDKNKAANHLNVDYKTGFGGNFTNVLKLFRYLDNNPKQGGNQKIHANLQNLRGTYIDPYNSPYLGDILFKDFRENSNYKLMPMICRNYQSSLKKVITNGNDPVAESRVELKKLVELLRILYLGPAKKSFSEEEDVEGKQKHEEFVKEAKEQFVEALESLAKIPREDAVKKSSKWKVSSFAKDKEDWKELSTEHYMAINSESFDKNPEQKNWRVELRAVEMPGNYEKLLTQINNVNEILLELEKIEDPRTSF